MKKSSYVRRLSDDCQTIVKKMQYLCGFPGRKNKKIHSKLIERKKKEKKRKKKEPKKKENKEKE